MKLALALCIAAAAATAPPRIELNLNAIQASFLEKHSAVGGTGTWERFHTIAGTNARGVQDYTERCPAGTGTNKDNCPIPIAHAWDSKNGEIKVNEQIYLVDDDGTPGVVPVKHVKYDGRRTYIIKYDATDDAGNKAEQLVFALILDDIKPPRISCDDWSSNGVTCDCRRRAARPRSPLRCRSKRASAELWRNRAECILCIAHGLSSLPSNDRVHYVLHEAGQLR